MPIADYDHLCWIAEVALDRAQPVLRFIEPTLFGDIDIAAILTAANIVVRSDLRYSDLRPRLAAVLDRYDRRLMPWIETYPTTFTDHGEAVVFWRGMLSELRGGYLPAFGDPDRTARWLAFVDAYRGRAEADDRRRGWLMPVVADARRSEELYQLIKSQRRLPLSPHDRTIMVHFGWNDFGDMPSLALMYEAFALRRVRRAWFAARDHFDDRDEAAILDAARSVLQDEAHAASAMGDPAATIATSGYDTSVDAFAQSFFAQHRVWPLAMIDRE